MVGADMLGEALARWAAEQREIEALVLIGSRSRAGGDPRFRADAHSDWDLQVVTSNPARFGRPDWLQEAGVGQPLAYVHRLGRLGTSMKVSAVTRAGELDLVVLPAGALRLLRTLARLGLVRRVAAAERGMRDQALVLQGGFRLLKGEGRWGAFYRQMASEFPPARLDDREAIAVAEGFVCDYVSTRHKVARGELAAAQRWLHLNLVEVNQRLRHELRQRQGLPTWPDLRRLEALGDSAERDRMTVFAVPTPESLLAATSRSAEILRETMQALVGPAWRWPDVE